jgi:hypothetical protein
MNIQKEIQKIKDKLNKLEAELSKDKWQKVSNLEWSEPIGLMTWRKACKKCEEMGGRLPTRVELVELADNHQEEIKDWETDYFFWSATTKSNATHLAWGVALDYGHTDYAAKTHEYDSRCVRDIK